MLPLRMGTILAIAGSAARTKVRMASTAPLTLVSSIMLLAPDPRPGASARDCTPGGGGGSELREGGAAAAAMAGAGLGGGGRADAVPGERRLSAPLLHPRIFCK